VNATETAPIINGFPRYAVGHKVWLVRAECVREATIVEVATHEGEPYVYEKHRDNCYLKLKFGSERTNPRDWRHCDTVYRCESHAKLRLAILHREHAASLIAQAEKLEEEAKSST
jgi:hypothetical protein